MAKNRSVDNRRPRNSTRAGPQASQALWASGPNAVEALLSHLPDNVSLLLVREDRLSSRIAPLVSLAEQHGIAIERGSADRLATVAGDERHQGIAACYQPVATRNESQLLGDLTERKKPWLVLVLDHVQDPHNLGACVRSAAAAGCDAVVVPRDQAVGVTPTVLKVSAGAAATMPFYQVVNLTRTLQQLKASGAWVFGAAGEAAGNLFEADFSESAVLVLGSEGAGLRSLVRKQCDMLFKIPMRGQVESLNVSVAAGICLFEVYRQRTGN